MAPTPPAVARETFAEGLMQAFNALGALADAAGDLSETATVRMEVTALVGSEAEVDGVAALLGAVPERPEPGRYEAVAQSGSVTVTVARRAGQDAPGSMS
jgi:hypothetical protein